MGHVIGARSPRVLLLVAALAVTPLVGTACTHTSTANTRVSLPSSPTALPTFTPAQFDALLKSLRGKTVVVNVWASWCGPCIAEAPGLASLSKQYQGRVQFVGVDIQDQVQPARAFIEKYGWRYPSVADPTGAIRNDLGLVGQPVTIVFDTTGKRVFVAPGAVSEKTLQAQLAKLA
jgi:thiol-disulfide isomerase/thioredoxin